MNKNIDIAAVGELLVDLTQKNIDGEVYFQRNAGGAPANMLTMASRLGKKTALIGKVGKDLFGYFLKDTVSRAGVDTSGLILADYPTTLDFVSLDESGDRSFWFFREHSADVMLSFEEFDKGIIDRCRVFHFGTVTMTVEPCRSATLEAVKYAKSKGKIISYDPNYRDMLWKDKKEAVKIMDEMISCSDIVKISDNEIEMLTGNRDYLSGAGQLIDRGVKFAFVTLGPDGCCYAASDGSSGYVPGFKVNAVDTTGAGDTFTGSVLSRLIDCDFNPSGSELEDIVRFANAAGAINATRRGAIAGMPAYEEIISMMKQ